ncbi:MAG TPA: hypothetical protein VGK87_03155, partial [Anaerolineae bacterium]
MSEPGQSFNAMMDAEVADFRKQYQRYLFILLVALAWIAALRFTLTYSQDELTRVNFPPLLVLIVTLLTSYFIRRRTVASLVYLLCGFTVTVSLEVLGHPGSPAVYLFTAVVILISAVAPTSVLIASGLGCALTLIVLLSNQLNWPA